MTIYTPYTYLIGWSKLDYWYYGCQHSKYRANPKNLWKNYFTSSKYVAMMRHWHGEPDVVQVRRIFRTGEQALRCEERVLDKVDAIKSDRWLNRGNAGRQFRNIGGYKLDKFRPISTETRKKMRLAKLGRKQSPEHIEKRRQAHLGRKNTEETLQKMRHPRLFYRGKPTKWSLEVTK